MSTEIPKDQKVRIPKATKQEQIFEIIGEDEDFRFGRIKVERDKQRFTLPAPTEDDAENTESVKTFYGVIVYFRKAFFNDQTSGEKIEKRELAILRGGKFMPELMYVSKAGFWNWKGLLKSLDDSDQSPFGVLIKFSSEPGQSSDGKFKFSKPKYEIVRPLEEDEMDYILELQSIVRSRVKKYSSNDELDAAEDKWLDDDDKKKSKKEAEEVDEDDDRLASKAAKRTRALAEADDDDDEDEKPKSKKSKKASDDDDDEDEKPKSKKSKKSSDDDDDEDEKPKSKKSKKSSDEDDDDEDEKPKSKKSKKSSDDDDDDDDEDLKPKSKKKSKKEEEPVTKGKGSYPDIDDDDDDED